MNIEDYELGYTPSNLRRLLVTYNGTVANRLT
jgi:hypothetical protein